jgi:hypothetical protein
MRDNDRKPSPAAETPMSDEIILKMAKEIAVKFIEVGRISPASFASSFATIYQAIEKTVREGKS